MENMIKKQQSLKISFKVHLSGYLYTVYQIFLQC